MQCVTSVKSHSRNNWQSFHPFCITKKKVHKPLKELCHYQLLSSSSTCFSDELGFPHGKRNWRLDWITKASQKWTCWTNLLRFFKHIKEACSANKSHADRGLAHRLLLRCGSIWLCVFYSSHIAEALYCWVLTHGCTASVYRVLTTKFSSCILLPINLIHGHAVSLFIRRSLHEIININVIISVIAFWWRCFCLLIGKAFKNILPWHNS